MIAKYLRGVARRTADRLTERGLDLTVSGAGELAELMRTRTPPAASGGQD